jgi:hypothetical protein
MYLLFGLLLLLLTGCTNNNIDNDQTSNTQEPVSKIESERASPESSESNKQIDRGIQTNEMWYNKELDLQFRYPYSLDDETLDACVKNAEKTFGDHDQCDMVYSIGQMGHSNCYLYWCVRHDGNINECIKEYKSQVESVINGVNANYGTSSELTWEEREYKFLDKNGIMLVKNTSSSRNYILFFECDSIIIHILASSEELFDRFDFYDPVSRKLFDADNYFLKAEDIRTDWRNAYWEPMSDYLDYLKKASDLLAECGDRGKDKKEEIDVLLQGTLEDGYSVANELLDNKDYLKSDKIYQVLLVYKYKDSYDKHWMLNYRKEAEERKEKATRDGYSWDDNKTEYIDLLLEAVERFEKCNGLFEAEIEECNKNVEKCLKDGYIYAVDQYQAQNFIKAYETFETLNQYGYGDAIEKKEECLDAMLSFAENLSSENKNREAYDIYKYLIDIGYKQAKDNYDSLLKEHPFVAAEIGDTVSFGYLVAANEISNFEKIAHPSGNNLLDNDQVKEKLEKSGVVLDSYNSEWIVLDRVDGSILLLSKNGIQELDRDIIYVAQKGQDDYGGKGKMCVVSGYLAEWNSFYETPVYWFLLDYFNLAFSDSDINMIQPNADGGVITLLSSEEAQKYADIIRGVDGKTTANNIAFYLRDVYVDGDSPGHYYVTLYNMLNGNIRASSLNNGYIRPIIWVKE